MSIAASPPNLDFSTNILQWNVRSLNVRLPSLQFLLSAKKCSIALLSETWLLPSRSINIPNYVTYRSDRHDGYGRVAIVVHNSVKSKHIPISLATRNDFANYNIDIVGVEVSLPHSFSPLNLWSCYIPSNASIPVTGNNLHNITFNLFDSLV